jgi:hypothetical protein
LLDLPLSVEVANVLAVEAGNNSLVEHRSVELGYTSMVAAAMLEIAPAALALIGSNLAPMAVEIVT